MKLHHKLMQLIIRVHISSPRRLYLISSWQLVGHILYLCSNSQLATLSADPSESFSWKCKTTFELAYPSPQLSEAVEMCFFYDSC